MDIKNSLDILNICKTKGLCIWEVAVYDEMQKNDLSFDQVMQKMQNTWMTMKESVKRGMQKKDYTIRPKMFCGDGKKIYSYMQNDNTLCGKTINQAMAYALVVMEENCSMGKIVACPTAGSCGVVPAALLVTMENRNFEDDMAVKALFVVALIGGLIARNATLSGAIGGCQAEIGSAAAMAAGALAFMCGATHKMIFDAAAIALNNMMGLVCDPVAGLVEVPCVKRNAMGVSNALICADMVLAGLESVIPFDEVVVAMDLVGKSMDINLKETSKGGIAATPTAKRLKKEIFGE